ncbi:CU044_2847 family protein [Streptomyces sp. G1]|uniref:CU044_2847 family protein n=1 Tax=Streptomyces sp. G1 TaxID=361572 RepID=UPI002548AEEF
MASLTRIPLDGGGCILVEQQAEWDGPVKASRIGDAVRELPVTLEGALEPVTEAVRATLDQLRKARPDQINVEFGVDLAFEAGAVITKRQASCHLKMTVSWKSDVLITLTRARVRADPGDERGEKYR